MKRPNQFQDNWNIVGEGVLKGLQFKMKHEKQISLIKGIYLKETVIESFKLRGVFNVIEFQFRKDRSDCTMENGFKGEQSGQNRAGKSYSNSSDKKENNLNEVGDSKNEKKETLETESKTYRTNHSIGYGGMIGKSQSQVLDFWLTKLDR